MNTHPERIALPLAAVLSLAAAPALAATGLFGGTNPLQVFIEFMTGPFAYGVVILALVAIAANLAIGGEFTGFARRMPVLVVAGAIVILADNVLTALFGGSSAASVPAGALPHAWPWLPETGP